MPRVAKRVLLIGWDGADWKMISPLLEAGYLPNLQTLVERGVMGNLTTLEPILSPLLWTSIATGKYGDEHNILGFAEPDGESGGVRPVRSTSRKCKALWNIVSDHGLRAGVVHWLASHPAECINGFAVSNLFFAEALRGAEKATDLNAVWPEELAPELAKYVIGPRMVTPKQLYPFVNIAEEDVREDERTAQLAFLLAQTATTQAIATYLMEAEEWDFLGVYYEGIDRFSHAFMEFHPPKMPHLSDEEFERFEHVMNGCYRFHDMMLGSLMELAGEDTVIMIVSDHGFHSDSLRPEGTSRIKDGKPVAWHRAHGLIAAAGPGTREDELIFGAGLLDIAPTVLAALGIPVGEDMAGQVLTQLWPEGEITWETVATHETPEELIHVVDSSETEEDPWAAAQMIQRLVDLGYIEDDSAEGVMLDRTRNLAIVYGSSDRPAEALAQYEQVLAKHPEDLDTKLAMAGCALQMGDRERCQQLADEVLAVRPEGPRAHLLMGRALVLEDDAEGALEHLLLAEKAEPRLPNLHVNLGFVHLRREAWEDAERAFGRALEIDPHAAAAHNGLGVALREQGRFEEAVEAHMQSVSLLHHQPEAHLNLGVALLKTGQIDWAIRAFETTLRLAPDDARAHHYLSEVYHWLKPDVQKSVYHASMARGNAGQ